MTEHDQSYTTEDAADEVDANFLYRVVQKKLHSHFCKRLQ